VATDPDGTDDISDEVRMLAAGVRERAATVPLGGGLAELALDALWARERDMTPEEIRRLAADAMDKAHQISFLLGKLATLLDDGDDGERR